MIYDTTKYSIHSCHREAVTYASSVAVSQDKLKALGNWKSDCFQMWTSRDDDFREPFSFVIGASLSGSGLGALCTV